MTWLPGNSGRPGPGSLLARWLEGRRAHPEAFLCGVREGGGRWRFRPSGVDPFQPDGVVTLRHGDRELRLRVRGPAGAVAPRPDYVVLAAVVVGAGSDSGSDSGSGAPAGPTSGAAVELSVPVGDAARFGVDL